MNYTKTWAVGLLTALFVLSVAPSSRAAVMKGKIKQVSPVKKQFVLIDDGNREWIFATDRMTKVILNKRPSMFRLLKPGDLATVTYEDRGGVRLVEEIAAERKVVASLTPASNSPHGKTSGSVRMVVMRNRELILADKAGKRWMFTVAAQAKIYLDGRLAKLDDLLFGDSALVRYQESGRQATAVEIVALRIKR